MPQIEPKSEPDQAVPPFTIATPPRIHCRRGRFDGQNIEQMRCTSVTDLDWLWQGYIASGNITLFTSLWKAGKTTLISVLLARLHDGQPLAGLRVRPSKT